MVQPGSCGTERVLWCSQGPVVQVGSCGTGRVLWCRQGPVMQERSCVAGKVLWCSQGPVAQKGSCGAGKVLCCRKGPVVQPGSCGAGRVLWCRQGPVVQVGQGRVLRCTTAQLGFGTQLIAVKRQDRREGSLFPRVRVWKTASKFHQKFSATATIFNLNIAIFKH